MRKRKIVGKFEMARNCETSGGRILFYALTENSYDYVKKLYGSTGVLGRSKVRTHKTVKLLASNSTLKEKNKIYCENFIQFSVFSNFKCMQKFVL